MTRQPALPVPAAASVQKGPRNVPCESEAKLTFPVGVTAEPPPVSVTVALQPTPLPTAPVAGKHRSVVVVGRAGAAAGGAVTVRVALPLLAAWAPSPG